MRKESVNSRCLHYLTRLNRLARFSMEMFDFFKTLTYFKSKYFFSKVRKDQRAETVDLGQLRPESFAPNTHLSSLFPVAPLLPRAHLTTHHSPAELFAIPQTRLLLLAPVISFTLTLLPQEMLSQFPSDPHFHIQLSWPLLLEAHCVLWFLQAVLCALNLYPVLAPFSLAVELVFSDPTIL